MSAALARLRKRKADLEEQARAFQDRRVPLHVFLGANLIWFGGPGWWGVRTALHEGMS